MRHRHHATTLVDLRRLAEERLPTDPGGAAAPPPVSAPDTQRLVHELQVHQIELEMQGEELRRAQAELEAGLARYKSLYDLAPVGYLTLARNGTIAQVNLTGAHLLGLERGRVLGRRLALLLSAKTRPVFEAFVRAVYERPAKCSCEVVVQPDGTTPRTLELTGVVEQDEDNCHLVATDITDRKRAEERIQRLNRSLAVLNRIDQLIVRERDVHALFAEACRVAVDTGGFRMAWVGLLDAGTSRLRAVASAGTTGNDLEQLSLFLSDEERSADATGAAILDGKSIACSDLENDCPSQLWREAAANLGFRAAAAFPLVVANQVRGAFSLFSDEKDFFSDDELSLLDELAHDLSYAWEHIESDAACRIMSQALREAGDQWERTFDATQDAICLLDVDKKIQRCNHAMSLLTGIPRESLRGQFFWAALHGSSEPIPECPVTRMQASRRRERAEMRLANRWIDVTVDPFLDENQNLQGAVTNVRDISRTRQTETQRKRLETRLRQAQKMEAIGRLAGGVAHDFNNLLAVILANAAMALEEAPEPIIARHLRDIEDTTQRAKALTSQLLACGRRQVLDARALDLNALVHSVTHVLERLIGETVRLDMVLAPELWPVMVDATQMEQVLLNLCVNARDAMPEGGRLLIETQNARLDADRAEQEAHLTPGDYVVVSVSDTGTGMDAGTLEHAFEPFFTTKPRGKGTGLGLPTVYGIVQQHKGSIEVHSEPGHGTTFKVFLPRAEGVKTEGVSSLAAKDPATDSTPPPPPVGRVSAGPSPDSTSGTAALRPIVRLDDEH